MFFNLAIGFFSSLLLAFLFTWFVKKIAERFGILDYPRGERKIHPKPMPLLGGLGIFAGFFLVLFSFVYFRPDFLLTHSLGLPQLLGLFIGGLILLFGGALDDKYDLKPRWQIFFSVLAVLAVILSGITIKEFTNPLGGVLSLSLWQKEIFNFSGFSYYFIFPADLVTFFWFLLIIYTTKFLDGLDGLVSGITVIGALTILFLTTLTRWYQPEVGLLAAMVAGAFAGFLFWNWHPAKIFLGNGGSLLAGFFLGSLAIISGSKIATTLLVLGVPILDALWVISRRIFWEKKSPTQADRKHLHFRLLDIGFSHRGAVLFLWLLAAIFGIMALFLQSREKIILLGLLFSLMIILGIFLVKRGKRIRL